MVNDLQHQSTLRPLVAWWILTGLFAACPYFNVQAQLDPTGRSGDRPPELQPREKPPELPRFEPQPDPSRPKTAPKKKIPLPRVRVRKINIEGGEDLPKKVREGLAEIAKKYENRDVTSEELEELRIRLNQFCIDEGFVTSGAILPDQEVTPEDAIITYKIISGKLSRIDIKFAEDKPEKQEETTQDKVGKSTSRPYFRIRESYIRRRLGLGAAPLNVHSLQGRMQLLLQNPNLERMNARLDPGLRLGESVLAVEVEDRQPYEFWTEYNNYQSPTVGSYRGLTTLSTHNLTGFSDALSVQYGRSEGLDPLVDVRYSFPFLLCETCELPLTMPSVGLRDTTFEFRYRQNDYGVIEAPFDPLDIQTKSKIFGITLRHPFFRTLERKPAEQDVIDHDVAMELIGEHLTSKAFLLGRGFSFSPGTDDGKAVVTALRFVFPDWVRRGQTDVFQLRSHFSFGLPIMGATRNSDSSLPDADFFAWFGQFQWARRWDFLNIETFFRTDLQLTPDPLFSLEQIALGGRYSVRGYRENQLVRDNGLVNQFEIRIPLPFLKGPSWIDYVQLAPFLDIGRGWDNNSDIDPQTLWSVGVGIRFAVKSEEFLPRRRADFELYWGYPLKNVSTPGGDLQDDGIHMRFAVRLF
jgi:hemolysin activation/secretion protein